MFQGSATDLEDGQLGGDSLVWSSDKDGDLGTGESLPINTLSAGEHTITLTATDSSSLSASQSITVVIGVRGALDVRPSAIDPNASADVPGIVTLPPGIPTTDINAGSLRLHIGDADLTPTSVAQLGDTDLDGLPELALTLDGAAVRAALTDPYVQTTIKLTGTMNNGAALAADAQIALVAPGDVDCDGSTNGADVLAALAYSTNIGLPDCLLAGDFNCDGTVAPLDVLGILGKIGGVSISAASCQTGTASASSPAESSGDSSGLAGGEGFMAAPRTCAASARRGPEEEVAHQGREPRVA